MAALGAACESSRLVPVISDGWLTGLRFFFDTKRWFLLFGLPLHLEAETDQVEEGA